MRNIIIYLIPSEHCKFILCEIMVGFKNVEKRPSTAAILETKHVQTIYNHHRNIKWTFIVKFTQLTV